MGFGGLGFGETLLILVLVLLVFGPRRLPEIGGALGKGIREFKRSVNEVKHELTSIPEPAPARPLAQTETQRPPVREAPAEAVSANTILPPRVEAAAQRVESAAPATTSEVESPADRV